MKRSIRVGIVTAALAAVFGGTLPMANATTVAWECSVDNGPWETFVVAPGAAGHGLETANNATKHAQIVNSEVCRVVES